VAILSPTIMEAILASLPSNHDVVHPTSPDLSDIYATFSSLLRQLAQSASIPTRAATSGESPALWLYDKCSSLPSPLGPLQFTLATLAALKSTNKEQALFDLFGEQDVELLFEIMGRESELSKLSEDDIRNAAGEENNAPSELALSQAEMNDTISSVEDHLYSLRNEAYELANILTTLRQDLPSSSVGPAGSGTHTVMRKSDKEAEKIYRKAAKQAAIAIEKAKEAAALTDGDIKILTALKDGTEIDYSELDSEWMIQNFHRGLGGMDERQIALMMADLAPEGTRVYDSSSQKGLPRGAIREIKEGYEQVIIPAPVLDRTKLPERIVLSEVLGEEERRAFAGTTSLNPMQSTVFDAAYCSRENLLICAPTGAGVSFLLLPFEV
jgi:hypothetical protein